jgi:hypothetical protein
VAEGVPVRELPDGGFEFVLDDPVLSAVAIESGVDGRVTLRFGGADVVLSGPFRLAVDGVDHVLDPTFPESLAPLLVCMPGAARWLWATPAGEFVVVMAAGQRIVVPAPTVRSAWSVGPSGPSPSGADVLPA